MLLEFEEKLFTSQKGVDIQLTDEAINEKYEKGEARIITEQGAVKLSLLCGVFQSRNYQDEPKYQLQPKYQRRITWDDIKRSKLIESFIMNVPVPPVFVYETEFDKYQVMDGLQRITAIIAFYEDAYELQGLNQWSELNGRKYSELPQKIKEGIDRRQLSVITLLKESSKNLIQEEEMKKMVFERLNTGGVTLGEQEIRNALYGGPFNDLCIKLSENIKFRKMWKIIPESLTNDDETDSLENVEIDVKNNLYKRMYDVELVLRYFAMRHIDEYSGQLGNFLDVCLNRKNMYTNDQLEILNELFETNISKVYKLFGSGAFCPYYSVKNVKKWGVPQKMIYDSLMLAIDPIDISKKRGSVKENKKLLEEFYEKNEVFFDGKKQSKSEIKKRAELFENFIVNDLV